MYGLRLGLSYRRRSRSLLKILWVLSAFTVPLLAVTTASAQQESVVGTQEPAKSYADPFALAFDQYLKSPEVRPLWIRQRGELDRARALMTRLEQAGTHGLAPSRYAVADLAQTMARFESAPDPAQAEALERALSLAFLRYARDMTSGAVDPVSLDARVHVDPERANLNELLKRAARSTDVDSMLDGLVPNEPRYRALRREVKRLMDQATRGGWGASLPAQGLAPGSSSQAVAALRKRLIAMGDLPHEPEMVLSASGGELTEIAAYDERLMGAVAAFQARHGLTGDGVVGPATLRALNAPIEMRLAQAMLNLERLRWRQGRLNGRRIEVNQANFRMTVFDDHNTPVHDARVVVGQKERRLQTPEFDHTMSYLVLNPTWTVPKSIIRREILAELQKDSGWLAKNNMILRRGGKSVNPDKIDWANTSKDEAGTYTVIQKPGPGNALGNVKFMFPNGYNIYLHDTPSKHLFHRDSRTFSHGCVRVERPFALAWLLLSDQTDDPGTLIEDILATEKQKNVPLERPIPISLFYMTAWVDDAGVLNFRDDVYGRDEILARALNAAS